MDAQRAARLLIDHWPVVERSLFAAESIFRAFAQVERTARPEFGGPDQTDVRVANLPFGIGQDALKDPEWPYVTLVVSTTGEVEFCYPTRVIGSMGVDRIERRYLGAYPSPTDAQQIGLCCQEVRLALWKVSQGERPRSRPPIKP